MNKQQLENITSNAPEGATHVTSENSKLEVFSYYKWHKLDLYFTWKRNGWSDAYRPIDLIHNLSDLQAQLDQLNEIERLKSVIESVSGASRDVCMCGESVNSGLHDHDIVTELDWVIGKNQELNQ